MQMLLVDYPVEIQKFVFVLYLADLLNVLYIMCEGTSVA